MPDELPPQAPPPPPPPAGFGVPPSYRSVYEGTQQRGSFPPPYPPAPRRSGWFWAAIFAAIGAAVIIVVCISFAVIAKSVSGSGDNASTSFGSNSIAVIDISGVIVDADKIDKQLQKYGDDDNVKAIVLHIDSPGGGAAASQEVYHEVLRIKQERHKRIVASVESVGASGAYYIASACDKIYANPASVVGSVGVIMEWTNYGDLLRWAKMKNVIIHAGELKDAGDPTREMTPKEEAYFQSLVDNMYGQFIHDVAYGRKTTDDKIKPLATGQVWTGEQALPLGLIDAQGGFRTALIDTARSVGITGEPHIVRPTKEKHGLMAFLNGENGEDLFPNPSQLLNRSPGFYFLWK
jgi:protease-4